MKLRLECAVKSGIEVGAGECRGRNEDNVVVVLSKRV